MTKRFTLTLTVILPLALGACELREDGTSAEDEIAGDGELANGEGITQPGMPSPTPSESESPVASIIRDDLSTEIAPVEVPVEPVRVVIPFPEGSNISAAAERRLAGLLDEAALEEEDWPVVLRGHTDASGNDQANLRASRARAEAVAAWLVERGVDDERIEVIAFGEQNPLQPNALPDGSPNESGRRANRRVEVSIAPPPATDGDAEEGDDGGTDEANTDA